MLENEGVALRAIRWSEIFPWLSIAKSFRLAVTLRLLTFGAAAVLLTLVGWWAIAGIFSHDEGDAPTAVGPAPSRTSRPGKSSIVRCRVHRPDLTARYPGPDEARLRRGPQDSCRRPAVSYLGRAQSTGVADPVDPAGVGRGVDGRGFLFAVALGRLEPGGVGLLRGGHQPRGRGAVGHRRAGGLGGGAALGPGEVAGLLFGARAAHAGSGPGRAADPGAGAADENRFPRRSWPRSSGRWCWPAGS